MAFIYQVRVSGPCLAAEKTSAVPTIWAKCFALTTQKFNKGRTKPNLSPNGDRSGYRFRSVQGRGQAFFGETSWNGTRPSSCGSELRPRKRKISLYLRDHGPLRPVLPHGSALTSRRLT